MMVNMSRPHPLQLFVGFALLNVGCGVESDSGQPVGDASGLCDTGLVAPSWAGWGQGFFRTHCSACHAQSAPDRHGAPAGVFFDTAEQVSAQSERIRWAVLEVESMPVGGGVPEADLILLSRYLDCGISDD